MYKVWVWRAVLRMKVKTDFITNSSSIAYIVMMPNNFYLSEDEIREIYKEPRSLYYEDSPPTEKEVIKELAECMEILKEGNNIWHSGSVGVSQIVYCMITDICQDHDFILTSIDINSEGSNIIQGVKEEVIEKLITDNIDILSILKLIRRTENDTSKIE